MTESTTDKPMRSHPKAGSMTHMPAGRSPSAAISREPPPSRLADAEAFIARSYATAVGTEEVDLAEARGRILARDLTAGADLPRFDASAVDGYAVRAADLGDGKISRIAVVGRSAAGHPMPRGIEAGEAARVFTGAMVPAGADLVLMQDLRLQRRKMAVGGLRHCVLQGAVPPTTRWPSGVRSAPPPALPPARDCTKGRPKIAFSSSTSSQARR